MLNFIYYPVSAILWFWHKVFGAVPFLGPDNGIAWALAVVFLVFTLRALLFKPFVSQVRSMRKMQEFAPEIKKLQEKHKGDRQKLAAEMQKLQSEHGVNPLGGCLPILIQIPVFIGLFQVLKEFKPGKTENYIFNESEVRSFIDADLFGSKLSAWITLAQDQLDLLGTTRPQVIAVAVPLMILASIATHWTARHSVQRQTPAAAANPQAAIMNKLTLYIFPLGVLVGGFFFPIAILIYWLSNNAWTLGQQWVVYRKIDREESEKKEAAATVKRTAVAPRPGQKPQRQKPKPTDADGDGDGELRDQSQIEGWGGASAPDSAPTVVGDATDAATGGTTGDAAAAKPRKKRPTDPTNPSTSSNGSSPSANGSSPQRSRSPRTPQKKGRKRR